MRFTSRNNRFTRLAASYAIFHCILHRPNCITSRQVLIYSPTGIDVQEIVFYLYDILIYL